VTQVNANMNGVLWRNLLTRAASLLTGVQSNALTMLPGALEHFRIKAEELWWRSAWHELRLSRTADFRTGPSFRTGDQATLYGEINNVVCSVANA
jgi:hypothetical protein